MDAAYASQDNSKSQSGIVVFLGGAMVFGASQKQKCMTKSPTESELVTLTDHISLWRHSQSFFRFFLLVKRLHKASTIFQVSNDKALACANEFVLGGDTRKED
jgi:hypothetical protein